MGNGVEATARNSLKIDSLGYHFTPIGQLYCFRNKLKNLLMENKYWQGGREMSQMLLGMPNDNGHCGRHCHGSS